MKTLDILCRNFLWWCGEPQIFDHACKVTSVPVTTCDSGVGVEALPMGHGQHGLLCLHPRGGGCLREAWGTLVSAIIGWWVYMRAAEQRRWPRCCLKGLVLLQINLPVKAPDFNSLVSTKISWHMQHFQMSNHTVLTLWNWKRKANLKAWESQGREPEQQCAPLCGTAWNRFA